VGAVEIDLGEGLRLAARWRSPAPPRIDEPSMVAFRADRVAVRPSSDQASGDGVPGEVAAAVFLGTCFNYIIQSGAVQVQAEGAIDHPIDRGQRVRLYVPPEHCHAFSAPGEA
jgi:DsbC/DsbD-like thiol-disulfide interchange protein